MTKKEMAYKLAKQFVKEEKEYWTLQDEYKMEKEDRNLSREDKSFWRGLLRQQRKVMETIKESADLLGLERQWSDAIYQAYIDQSKEEKQAG